jgi:hypothetical protein
VRVEEAEMQYKRMLGYSKTRWLSLSPAVERILQMYSPLKYYFLSQEKCPAVLHAFFSNECSELWLKFVHVQASIFNNSVKMMEGDKTTFTGSFPLVCGFKKQVHKSVRK